MCNFEHVFKHANLLPQEGFLLEGAFFCMAGWRTSLQTRDESPRERGKDEAIESKGFCWHWYAK